MTSRKRDFYSQKARREHYRARSIYKLQEIHQNCRIFRKKDRVLDLGCSPGSWSQFALESVGPGGWVAGVDISPISPLQEENFQFFSADIFTWEPDRLPISAFDVVLSDMAPSTTGIKITDRERSYQLSLKALEWAEKLLKPGGRFVCKIFQGEDWGDFVKRVRTIFTKTKIFKPRATRKESVETYVIALGRTKVIKAG